MSAMDTKPMHIHWRKLPKHSRTKGWVGVPFHGDGFPVSHFRYYISPTTHEGLPMFTQWGEILPGDGERWEFKVDGDPTLDPEVCRLRCGINWVETLKAEHEVGGV